MEGSLRVLIKLMALLHYSPKIMELFKCDLFWTNLWILLSQGMARSTKIVRINCYKKIGHDL